MQTCDFYELGRQLVLLTTKRIHPHMRKLGLYPGQEIFLTVIAHHEGITLIELAEFVKRERSTITKAVQSLENGEFIRCEFSSTDKRKKYLYLTDKGRETVKQLDSLGTKIVEKYNQLMTEDEKRVVQNILKKISQELKKEGIKNDE